MKTARLILLIGLFLLLVACSSEPPKSASENKPAEAKPAFQPTYLTGREALQKMYVAARAWAADCKPYSLRSQATKDANGHDGKAGLWSAGFASAARRSVKVFTWSGMKADGAPDPGISNNVEDTYNPANTSTAVFDMAFLKVDSDEVAKTALKHGGDKELKKGKDSNIFYALNWNARGGKLLWRVVYGPELNDPELAVDIDASSGTFTKVEK
jgi:hypothetical protein